MALNTWTRVASDTDINSEFGENKYRYVRNNGAGTASFSLDASTATLSYALDYTYVESFVEALLGKTTYTFVAGSSGGANYLNRTLPEPHPFYYNFYASRCDVTPYGASDNEDVGAGFTGPVWDKAIVTAVFTAPTYKITADDGGNELNRFVTKEWTSNVDYLTTQGQFKIVDGSPAGKPLTQQPGFPTPSAICKYTWHQIPVGMYGTDRPPNWNIVQNLLGVTNSDFFDYWNPGLALLLNAESKLILPNVATDKNYYWDLTYYVGVRENGWNYIYNPLAGAWQEVTTTGLAGGQHPYPSADLNKLFNPNQFQ